MMRQRDYYLLLLGAAAVCGGCALLGNQHVALVDDFTNAPRAGGGRDALAAGGDFVGRLLGWPYLGTTIATVSGLFGAGAVHVHHSRKRKAMAEEHKAALNRRPIHDHLDAAAHALELARAQARELAIARGLEPRGA